MHTMYKTESKYLLDMTRVALPIARRLYPKGLDTVSVVQLGAPTARREIVVEAERLGDWPKLPQPLNQYTDVSANSEGSAGTLVGTLLDHVVLPLPPQPTVDGKKRLYYLRASYTYQLNRPPTFTERLAIGFLPFLSDSPTAFPADQVYGLT